MTKPVPFTCTVKLALACSASWLLLAPAAGIAGKIGPVEITPTLHLSAEYNSNINASAVDPLEDFILGARLDFTGSLPVTRLNALDFSFGVGYRRYLRHRDRLDTGSVLVRIAPNLDFTFTIRISEYMRVVLSERLRLDRDPTDVLAVDAGGAVQLDILQFNRIENTAAARYEWDINERTQFHLTFARMDLLPIDSAFDSVRRTVHSLDAMLARRLGSRLTAGLNAGASWIDYRERFYNDGDSRRVGAFAELVATQRLTFNGGVSHIWHDFSQNGLIGDTSSPGGWQWNVGLRHTPTSKIAYSIDYARTYAASYSANIARIDSVTGALTWTGFRKSDLRLTLRYDWGEDSGGRYAEKYRRWFAAAEMNFPTGPNSGLSLHYHFSDKWARPVFRGYLQHRAGLTWFYRF